MIPARTGYPAHGEDVLHRHVARELRAAGWEAGDGRAADVARGVALRWSEQQGGETIPSDYLALLIARALWSLGEREAARRLIDREARGSEGDLARHTLNQLPPSLPVWRCLQARLYRAGSWSGAGSDPVWILDLARLKGMDADPLELAWFPVLRLLLTGMAELWDATAGAGVLGLRGLARGRTPALREQAAYLEAVLQRLRKQRGWTAEPRLLWLDARAASCPLPVFGGCRARCDAAPE